jgi:signal transduction histidine kinase
MENDSNASNEIRAKPLIRVPIRRKLLAAFMLAVAVPLLALAVYLRVWTETSLMRVAMRDVNTSCREATRRLEGALALPREDVLFLSQAPDVLVFAQALASGERAKVEELRPHVAELLQALAKSRDSYAQLRFLDSEGMEIIRVNAQHGRSWVVPDGELQSKADRYYFQEALGLREGRVYVSRIDLNREYGEVRRPLEPMIRFASTLRISGDVAGVVVANMLADALIDPIRRYQDGRLGRQFLIDERGFYVAHPEREKQWGHPSDLGHRANVRIDATAGAQPILGGRGGTFDTEDEIVAYQRVRAGDPVGDHSWVVFQRAPKAGALASALRFRLVLTTFFVVGLVVALGLSVMMSKRLIDPLRAVERGAELVGAGQLDHRLEVATGDEIEVLARRFNDMARQLEAARDQERLALVGRMAAGIVHDLKSPLTSIKGFTDLLVTAEEKEEREEFCQIVSEEAERILAMVQELLDFSRGRPTDLKRAPTDLKQFLSQVCQAIRRDMERVGIEVEVRAGGNATVDLDVPRMTRVLLNLAGNAREAMRDTGGTFTLRCELAAGTARVVLEDTGPGVPAEIANRLFEPFVTEGKGHGTGLGLAICKQIVEAHNGRIWLDAGVEQGARFVIELPLGAEDESKGSSHEE